MITSIALVVVGILLFLTWYGLNYFLGYLFMYGSVPKQLIFISNLFYLIPIGAIGCGVYRIVKHLFF